MAFCGSRLGVGHAAWMRRVVLILAIIVGGTLGIGPLLDLALGLGNELMVVATRWHDPT